MDSLFTEGADAVFYMFGVDYSVTRGKEAFVIGAADDIFMCIPGG